ncbi:hypothetical protein D3C84_1150900 [compost metagenome]
MHQVQAEVAEDGCAQSTETVGEAVTDPGQTRQYHPLPASPGVGQAEDQRRQQQGEGFTLGQGFHDPAQSALDIAAKQRFLDQGYQQQVVEHP